MPPIPHPPVQMVFDGVLITHLNDATGFHQVGVVPAPEHQFSIIVTEFQQEMTSEGPVDAQTMTHEIRVSDFPPAKRIWTFEVTDGTATPASVFNCGTKPQRLAGLPSPPLSQDFRWPPQLHDASDFPQHDALTKQTGVLNPIINFRNGLFFTKRTTPATPRVFRKANGDGRELLGIMSLEFAANIEEITANAAMVLKNGANEEIFKVIFRADRPRRFSILFQNTPPHLHPSASGATSHFPLFYSAFRPATKRYDLVTDPPAFPGFSIPDLLGEDEFQGPAPFRCGPVGVNVPLGE